MQCYVGKRVCPDDIAFYAMGDDKGVVAGGCYSIVVQLLLDRKLISNTIFQHYPSLTELGVRILRWLQARKAKLVNEQEKDRVN